MTVDATDFNIPYEALFDRTSFLFDRAGALLYLPYQVAETVFSNRTLVVTAQDVTPVGVNLSSTGLRLYIMGAGGSDSVHQYNLTTAFDVSTAIFSGDSLDVNSEEPSGSDLHITPDGTKIFVMGLTLDQVYQYTLTTPFEVSTASYDNEFFDFTTQDTTPLGLTFSLDGTKMYMAGSATDNIFEYDLATGFDLSDTVTFTGNTLSVAANETTVQAVSISGDGKLLFVIGSINETVDQYSMTTPFDLSTATYDNIGFDVNAQDGDPFGLDFSPDGTKMYVLGNDNNTVFEYFVVRPVKD